MLKQILTALALAAGLAGGRVAAANATCQGDADGPGHSTVQVFLEVDSKGRAVSRNVAWTPPAAEPGLFPMASIDYYEPGPRLGAPNRLGLFAVADLQKGPPKSDNVEIQAVIDGRVFAVPWRYYAANIEAARRQLAHPGRNQLALLTGAIPIAYQKAGEEPLNPDLLPLLATARTLELHLNGDAAGESFGAKTYDLSDLQARDALYAEASAKADEAARTPKACRKR